MPEWIPEPIWQDEEVFIIGGGSSLRDFDWLLLRDEHTIGCNQAFRLGPEICDVCIFCDIKFIFRDNNPRKGFYDELERFPNPVVTNNNVLGKRKIPWLKYMPRKVRGLGRTSLGYNKNTGAAAINLALLMGAKIVYLLGFDMFLDKQGRPNWHDKLLDKPCEKTYVQMLEPFDKYIKKDLETMFPECRVINVTKNSNLNTFPKVDPYIFWLNRKEKICI